MSVTLARFAQIAPMPWKNGRGVTTQLAIHPRDATANEFEWRVSIAQVTVSTQFSTFPGISRCLAILEGEMKLVIEGLAPIDLTPDSSPTVFAGDVSTEGRVEGASVLDLNLMYDARKFEATMQRIATHSTTISAATTLFCALQPTRVRLNDEHYELARFDLLNIESRERSSLESTDRFDAYRIELRKVTT